MKDGLIVYRNHAVVMFQCASSLFCHFLEAAFGKTPELTPVPNSHHRPQGVPGSSTLEHGLAGHSASFHSYLTILFNPSHVQAVSFGSLCCCISPHKPTNTPLDLRAPTALSAQVERYLHVGLEVFTAHLLIHRSAILILKSSPRLRVAGTQRLICMGQPAGRFSCRSCGTR